MSYKLTDEQINIIKAVSTGNDVAVTAGAGTGKTSTAVALCKDEYMASKKVLALTFNKKNAVELEGKMPSNVTCKTFHSLAFRFANKNRIFGNKPRVRAIDLARMLAIDDVEVRVTDGTVTRFPAGYLAGIAIKAIGRFCASIDAKPGKQHIPIVPVKEQADKWAVNDAIRKELVPALTRAWNDITSTAGKLPYEHDYYLKMMHLAILEGKSFGTIYDVCIIDEAQDSSPCRLAIGRASGKQLILIGDSNQMIYEWNGSVDVLNDASMKNAERCNLSQSFRFGPAVADMANIVLAKLPTDLVLKGFDAIASSVAPVASPKAVLCRTNGGVLAAVLEALSDNKKPFVTGGVGELTKFVEGAADLQLSGRTEHPDLRIFSSWGDCVETVANDDTMSDLRTMVTLCDKQGTGRLLAALRACQGKAEYADLEVSTIHKSKGGEWDTVRLSADIARPGNDDLPGLRLLYVAVTRAQVTLDVSNCPAFEVDATGAVRLSPEGTKK